jgi:hypothetical protein
MRWNWQPRPLVQAMVVARPRPFFAAATGALRVGGARHGGLLHSQVPDDHLFDVLRVR